MSPGSSDVTDSPVTDRPWTDMPVTDNPLINCLRGFNFQRTTKEMNVLERFGRRVREKRMVVGLSQEAFADKCKLDRTYISGVERGKRNLSLRNIDIIAKTLGMSMSELLDNV